MATTVKTTNSSETVLRFHAQPYDISAVGFYFESVADYTAKAKALRNDYGDPVEEFEIQFIDGEAIDCALAHAVGVHQGNVGQFFEIAQAWSDEDKRRYILAVGECGYAFDLATDDPDSLEVDIYTLDTMRELAEQFVDDGLMGEIPVSMRFYFDYDALARDLAVDYTATEIAGERLIYRCA